jgi:hypothetical protein
MHANTETHALQNRGQENMSAAASGTKFDQFFRKIVKRTCTEWGYEIPQDEYYMNVYERLPLGLRVIIESGLSSGLINDVGVSKTKSAAFRPIGVPENKGPYSWFERNSRKKQPRPCWEYFVQLAEYTRLYEAFQTKEVKLSFEDDLMDIGIYRKKMSPWVCCEIKEKSSQAQNLIRGVKKYQTASELPDFDRGNDPLRKAKYIVSLKPEYFYVVSIGRRFEFRIEYPKSMQFQLVEDLVPFI